MTRQRPISSYAIFRRNATVALAGIDGFADDAFVSLAADALRAFQDEPERREAIAYVVTDVWVRCFDNLTSSTAMKIGELFADLELPEPYVEDAPAQWARLATLIHHYQRPSIDPRPKHVS